MEFSDLNRRGFLKTSATAAAVGAGLSAGSVSAAALSQKEIAEWKNQVGSRFAYGDAELLLRSVDATDYTADAARPRHLRTHSVMMLFVLQSGTVADPHETHLKHAGEKFALNRVVPPRGEAGQFFELVLN